MLVNHPLFFQHHNTPCRETLPCLRHKIHTLLFRNPYFRTSSSFLHLHLFLFGLMHSIFWWLVINTFVQNIFFFLLPIIRVTA
jgi:hypothetical protein